MLSHVLGEFQLLLAEVNHVDLKPKVNYLKKSDNLCMLLTYSPVCVL